MTSKSLFFKLMKEDMKRRIWAVGLAFLSMFFCMPVAAAMGIGNIAQRYERWLINGTGETGITAQMLREEKLLELVESILGLQNVVTALVIGTAAMILGLTGFMYLHSKKQVDFYHSIPVRRELLFGVKYLDGVLLMFAMYLLNMLFAAGIFAVNGVNPGLFLSGSFLAMLVHMTGFLLVYTVMVIAVLLTGNFFISILGGAVLYSYVPAVLALVQGLMYMFFVTMNGRKLPLGQWMVNGSPVSYYISMVGKGADQAMFVHPASMGNPASVVLKAQEAGYGMLLKDVGMGLLASLILAAVALLLYRRRSSEAAGKAMAFSVSRAPVKILLVVPITIMSSLLFWNVYFKLSWAVFGFLLGLVLTHCIIEIIYHFEFRKLFANPAHMAVSAVLSLAVLGFFRYDLIGYDKYIPGDRDCVSASISTPALEDWHDYGLPERSEYEYGWRWRYMMLQDYAAGNMEVSDYAAVRAIAENAIKYAKIEKENKLHNRDNENRDGFWAYVELGWHLSDGKTVYRNYHVNVTEVREAVDAIYATEEYKRGAYPVMDFKPENIVALFEANASEIKEVETSDERRAEILSTYQKELVGLTLKERETEVPVLALRFLTEAEREYLTAITKGRYTTETEGFKLEVMEEVNFFPVYPSFTKTLALLEEAGAFVDTEIPLEDVERIEISHSYLENLDQEKYGDEAIRYETYTDEKAAPEEDNTIILENDGTAENTEKIQEILASTVPEDLSTMNMLRSFESGFSIRVYQRSVNEGKRPSEEEWKSYTFKGTEIPAFLQEAVRYEEQTEKSINYGLNREK